MRMDKFYKETLILSTSNLTMGILRFVFSVILSKKLGSEGLGLFSIIMPIYDLFCCLTCGGLIAAVSRKGAELQSIGKLKNLIKVVKVTMIFDFLWSFIISSIVFFSSDFIAIGIIKDPRAIYSLRLLCPAIIFVSLANIIKGYFYSISKAAIPAYIDIFEKLIRIVIVIYGIELLVTKNIENTVALVYFALLVGEGISFLLLYFFYKLNNLKLNISKNESLDGTPQILFDILIVSIPLCINGFLTAILGTASTLIVPRRLVAAGFTYNEALVRIGEFSGMALTITFFPSVVIMSMSTLLIPNISKYIVEKNHYELEKRITQVIKISILLGISTLIICISIPSSLGQLFFNNTHITGYIIAAAISTPFTYVLATTFGIISGLGNQTRLLINSIILSIIEIACLYIFSGIKVINIYGYAIALLIMGIVGVILNIHEIKKYSTLNFHIIDFVVFLMCGALTFFIIGILNNVIPILPFNFKIILIILTGFILYILSVYYFQKKIK